VLGRWFTTLTEDADIISVDITSGDAVREVEPDDWPSDFSSFESELETTGQADYYQVTTEAPFEGSILVDANMDGSIDEKDELRVPDGYPPVYTALKSHASGMLVLDINNNNTDADTTASPFKAIHDHLSPDLDAEVDRAELTSTNERIDPGHHYGNLLLRLPKASANAQNLTGKTATGKLDAFLKRTGDACVRIHLAARRPWA
jgi:hypothetical protein